MFPALRIGQEVRQIAGVAPSKYRDILQSLFVKEAAFMKATSVRWTASLKIDCASEYFCNDSDHKP